MENGNSHCTQQGYCSHDDKNGEMKRSFNWICDNLWAICFVTMAILVLLSPFLEHWND